jgi:hypothetical protein
MTTYLMLHQAVNTVTAVPLTVNDFNTTNPWLKKTDSLGRLKTAGHTCC